MKHQIKNAVLVYQGGIANVFAVDHVSEVSERRGLTERLLQSDFRTAESFCRGLQAAGVPVDSMHCNMAGDIALQTWHMELSEAPFRKNMRPVGSYC